MGNQQKPGNRLSIAVLIGRMNLYTDLICFGMAKYAEEKDINLIILGGKQLSHDQEGKYSPNIIYQLANGDKINGIIILASYVGQFVSPEELVDFCNQFSPTPVVIIGEEIEGFSSISVDNSKGLYDLICHLIDVHDRHRIAFIQGPANSIEAQTRYETYRRVLRDREIPFDPDLVVPGGFQYSFGRIAMEEMVQRGVDFDAVVSAADASAWGALDYLRKCGIHVPYDAAVIGFDDYAESRYTIPPLSTVRQPRRELGVQAIEIILEQLTGTGKLQHRTLMTEMVLRQSCGCLAPTLKHVQRLQTEAESVIFKTNERKELIARQDVIWESLLQVLKNNFPNDVSLIQEDIACLFDTFFEDIDGENTGEFLIKFDHILQRAVEKSENLDFYHSVLSNLRVLVLKHLKADSEIAGKLEIFWEQAFITLSNVIQHVQYYRYLTQLRTEIFFEINEDVITTFDLPKLMQALVEAFQQLDIQYGFLCLNDDPGGTKGIENLPTWSRLVLAYVDGEALSLESGGVRFLTEQILPEKSLSSLQRYSFYVLPLRFQDHYLGHAVFEVDRRLEFIYDALQIQISGAIQGALLIDQLSQARDKLEHRVEERTAELQREIAERSRVEEVLRENEQRFRALFEQTADAVFLFDLNTRFLLVNQKAADMLGYTTIEMIWLTSDNVLAPDELEDEMDKLKMALQGQPIPLYERNLVHKDGHLIPVEINLTLVTDSDENPLYFQSVARDITHRIKAEQVLKAEIEERKRTEKILQENEKRFRALFEQTNDAIFIIDLEGQPIAANNQTAVLLGYTVEELLDINLKEIIAPDEYPNSQKKLQALLAGESLPIFERTYIHKDGHPIQVEINTALVYDEAGNPLHIQSIIRDISMRKRSERILQALNTASLAMRERTTPKDIFAAVGNELKTLGFECTIFQTNYDLSEISPQYYSYDSEAITAVEKLMKVDLGKFAIPIEKVEIFKKTIWEQEPLLIRDPDEAISQLLPKPVKGVTKQIVRLLNVSRTINVPLIVAEQTVGMLTVQAKDLLENDIPMVTALADQMAASWQKARLMQDLELSLREQLRIEDSLRDSEEKFRSLFELSPEAMVLVGLNGIILDANQAIENIGGLKKNEIIGQSFLELGFWNEDQQIAPGYNELFSQAISGELTESKELQLNTQDGESLWIEVHPALLKGGDEILALQLIIRDITDRRKAEQAIQQRVNELEAIYKTSLELAKASLRVDGIAEIAIKRLRSVLKVDKCVFYFLEINKQTLTMVADIWYEDGEKIFHDQKKVYSLDEYPTTKWVINSMLPAVIQADDPEADPMELVYMQANSVATLAIIPLVVKSQVIGIMELETWEQRDYTPNQLNLAVTLANQIAVTLDNARLFESAQQELNERLQAELALQESEEQFRSIFENAVMGLYRTTPDGRILMANPALIRMLGYDSIEQLVEQDMEGNGSVERFSREEFKPLLEKDGHVLDIESTWKRRDGSIMHAKENAKAICDENGEIVFYEGTVEDITQQKQVEALQRIVEERFNKAFNISPLAMGIQGVEGEKRGLWLLINDAFSKITGYPRSEVIGHTTQELQLYADLEQREQATNLFLEEGYVREYEFSLRKKSGELRHGVLWSERLLVGDETNALVLIQDITEKKRVEEERQKLIEFQLIVATLSTRFINLSPFEIENDIQLALESIAEYAKADASSVWLFSADKSTASKTHGWPSNIKEETNQDVPISRFPWIFGKLLNNEHVVVSRKQDIPPEVEDMHFLFDNRIMAAIVAVPLVSEGDVIGALGIYMRETERKWADDLESLLKIIGDIIVNALERKRADENIRKLNEELEQRVIQRTQQLELANTELEAFAYSISHDLRAPLRAIDGFSLALLEDYYDLLDTNAKNYLQRIRAASQRMGQLIDDILKLSRITRNEMTQEEVDLSQLVREILNELQETDPEREVTLALQPKLITLGDKQLLKVMLTNLCSNAWKFTSKKEHAIIEFGCSDGEDQPIFYIRDNGAGFDMIYADKLFGTFQRLHPMNEFEGTGIGLATVKRIVNRHGGRVWAESQIDQGATFYFTIGELLDK